MQHLLRNENQYWGFYLEQASSAKILVFDNLEQDLPEYTSDFPLQNSGSLPLSSNNNGSHLIALNQSIPKHYQSYLELHMG